MKANDLLTLDTLDLLIRLSPGLVAVFDTDMKYILASERWIKDFKIEQTPILGRSHYDIFPEILEKPEWLDMHRRALAGEVIKSDGEIWDRDHGREFIKYEIHPWLTPDGSIGGIVILDQVETTLKKMESALRETNEICKRVMSNSPIGIALLNTDGKWMDVNNALCDLLGYEKEELLQTDFQSITHSDDLDIDVEHVQKLLTGEQTSYLLEKRYLTKSRKIIWALLSATLLRNEDNTPAFFLSQILDITALKDSDQLRENFISLVSHELRTPLTSLMLSLDSLEQYNGEVKDGLFDKYLTIAHKNCHRLHSLIGDIIDAERLQTKSFSYSPQKTDMREIVEQSISMNMSLGEAYGICIEKEIQSVPRY